MCMSGRQLGAHESEASECRAVHVKCVCGSHSALSFGIIGALAVNWKCLRRGRCAREEGATQMHVVGRRCRVSQPSAVCQAPMLLMY